ncbi:MAG TPA: dienelactone hydrolase family protein [Acidimicrobiales bacterium]|nr:dienelactone hydrolase family protein [Acidimicrobiales bacterium]
MRRGAATAMAGVALFVAACGGGGSDDGPAAVAPAVRQPLALEERTETFVDTSRTTEAHATVAESVSRTLPTRILSPAGGQAGGPYPLIVFAHGSGGLGTGYDVLLRTWAEAGHVVAAPAFPIARDDAAAGDWQQDLPKLPGDMTFVIDQVLRLSADAGSPLRGAVDPDRIGVAGHSMGGMTALAVAGNTCCHDARIKAAVILAGRETPFGSGRFWSRIKTPVLLVHGDADYNVLYGDGKKAFANAPPPRFLLTIVNGDHGTPFTGDRENLQASLVTDVTLDFFDHYLRSVPQGLDRLQARAAAPGVATLEQER